MNQTHWYRQSVVARSAVDGALVVQVPESGRWLRRADATRALGDALEYPATLDEIASGLLASYSGKVDRVPVIGFAHTAIGLRRLHHVEHRAEAVFAEGCCLAVDAFRAPPGIAAPTPQADRNSAWWRKA
ncbi:MAG: hypothetical protein WCP29_13660 [Acidobacteriota bacterium]